MALDAALEPLHVLGKRGQVVARGIPHVVELRRADRSPLPAAHDEERDDRTDEQKGPPGEAAPPAVATRGRDAVDEVDEDSRDAVVPVRIERLRRERARLAARQYAVR